MKISVVISTYNGEKYLEPQLESIRKQTVQPDQVLIFDDCSTDKTSRIAQAFIQKFNLTNWKVTINEHNKGWRKNFIDGIKSCNGDLIFTGDQDDIWRQDKIAVMSKIMQKNSNIQLLTSNYCELYENGKRKVGPWKNTKQLNQIKLQNNYFLIQSPGCTYCFRRSLAEICLKYWRSNYPHDALLWRFALFANVLYTYTDDLIIWRKHATSAFSKESRDLKTITEKKKWLAVAESFNSDLKKFLKTDFSGEQRLQRKALKRVDYWILNRKKFYYQKNPLTGLKLAFYLDCYPRYRQYLGDWFLIYLKRK